LYVLYGYFLRSHRRGAGEAKFIVPSPLYPSLIVASAGFTENREGRYCVCSLPDGGHWAEKRSGGRQKYSARTSRQKGTTHSRSATLCRCLGGPFHSRAGIPLVLVPSPPDCARCMESWCSITRASHVAPSTRFLVDPSLSQDAGPDRLIPIFDGLFSPSFFFGPPRSRRTWVLPALEVLPVPSRRYHDRRFSQCF